MTSNATRPCPGGNECSTEYSYYVHINRKKNRLYHVLPPRSLFRVDKVTYPQEGELHIMRRDNLERTRPRDPLNLPHIQHKAIPTLHLDPSSTTHRTPTSFATWNLADVPPMLSSLHTKKSTRLLRPGRQESAYWTLRDTVAGLVAHNEMLQSLEILVLHRRHSLSLPQGKFS